MTKINPLISTKNLVNDDKSKKRNKQGENSDDVMHEFYLATGYKEFSTRLNSLEQNKHYTFVTFGQWSLKHVVFHLIKLIGSCDIYSTTYGLGPSSARGIVSSLKSGMISSFHFLYDWKIKTYKVEAHDICSVNFPVKLANIHAKVTVLLNDSWGISITGSANWSDTNNKIETTIISTNRDLAEFHKNWILAAMDTSSTEPKKILKEINESGRQI